MALNISLYLKNNKDLLLLKASLLLLNGGLGTVYLFLTLHMKDLGLTIFQTSLINAIVPVGLFLTPIFTGMIVDRFGQYKFFLCLFFSLMTAFFFSLAFIPTTSNNISKPINGIFHCNKNGGFLQTNQSEFSFFSNILLNESCFISCKNNPSVICFLNKTKTQCNLFQQLYNENTSFALSNVEFLLIQNISNEALLQINNFTYNDLSYQSLKCLYCELHCNLSVTAESKPVEHILSTTFIIYFVVRCLSDSLVGCFHAIWKTVILSQSEKYGSNFGNQYAYSYLGPIIMAPLAGYFIDYLGGNYIGLFSIYLALMIIVFTLYLPMSISVAPSHVQVYKNFIKLLSNFEVCTLLIVVFVHGTLWHIMESFLSWFLTSIGATKALIGWTLTCSFLPCFIVLHFHKFLLQGIKKGYCITIGFIYLGLRCIGYSTLTNPWYALIFELSEVMSVQIPLATYIVYADELSKNDTRVTLQGLLTGAFYGLGRMVGFFISGKLTSTFGYRITFRIIGISCFIFSVFYLLFFNLIIEKSSKNKKMYKVVKQ